MNPEKATFDRPVAVPRVAEVLEQRYEQMCGWALALTRGDSQQAEEILHDLCLHLVMSRPDFGRVGNLDGYLYTSLRHVYLSHLSRSSREALQAVTCLEFDSIHLSLFSRRTSDALSQQNQLRRICDYALSRKASVKSASFFILQFFYGYTPQETAGVARVPPATVHNKVGRLREELRRHLATAADLRPDERSVRPTARLQWTSIPSAELFQELRGNILAARDGNCPNHVELLRGYSSLASEPLDRSLLSHVVSCESCLRQIHGHLGGGGGKGKLLPARRKMATEVAPGDTRPPLLGNRTAFLDLVEEHAKYLSRHHPARLSMAVDGKVLVTQDVQARWSAQTARIEKHEPASFVEVFSELGLRLALLRIGPPAA